MLNFGGKWININEWAHFYLLLTWSRLSVINRGIGLECFEKFIPLKMNISPACECLWELRKWQLTRYKESKMKPVVQTYEMEFTYEMEYLQA